MRDARRDGRIRRSLAQFSYLRADLSRIVNGRRWRWLTVWFGGPAHAVVAYRVSRATYIALGGRAHATLRILLAPVLVALRPWFGRCEVHHRADIGPGLAILHPTLGVVVSAHTRAGVALTLTGGNCFGMRGAGRSTVDVGDYVMFGANATALGPIRIGNRVTVGAGAVVTRDAPDGALLAGVPAEVRGTKLI